MTSETGASLIELLVASSAAVVIFIAASGFAQIARRSQDGIGGRVDALGQQRAGLERMTRELRQATTVTVTTPSIVDFQRYAVGGTTLRAVRFDCSQASQCRRSEGPATGPLVLTHNPLVTGVQSAAFAVQTLSSSQDYVTLNLWVSSPGRTTPSALEDAVYLRNKRGT